MAYQYLNASDLKDALNDSEGYMKPFFEPLDELERLTDGRPGKVPKGKPRVTDGTLAGYKRETPKQVIQQVPTGHVIIKQAPEMQDNASAILTDVILKNANAGGTPYDKAKLAIEDCYPFGSAWFYCYFDRRGSLLHANYRLVNARNILFEKGKVSEFDSNIFGIVEYMTKNDIKARIWWAQHLSKQAKDRGDTFNGTDDLKAWQALLDSGASEKDEQHKTEEEKRKNETDGGYYKTIRWMQIGKDATFYRYAPKIDKVLTTETTKDPRGIIPLHGLVPAPSTSNPIGRPLAAISAGKQNLLDFRMQMEQYREGMGLSPTLKKWGQTPLKKIKIVPDHIIEMTGNKQTDDVEVLDITTNSNRNYANDSSYIKTQIYNEQGGSNDTSVGADANSVGFSKTDSGVKQQAARTSVSKDDMRRMSEAVHERVFETLLNIHFAESKGTKQVDITDATMKRLKLSEAPKINYDTNIGPIQFSVDAGTSQADNNDSENQKLTALLELKLKYGTQADEKTMKMINQIIKNSGVDDPENMMYTDVEIEFAKKQDEAKQQLAMQQMTQVAQAASQPQQDQQSVKPLGESIAWKPGDLKPSERAQALRQVGIQADMSETPTPNDAAAMAKAQTPATPSMQQPVGQPTQPAQAPSDPQVIAQDRQMALDQLMQRGMSQQDAESILQMMDGAMKQ